jgi:starch phosphorylase
VKVYSGDLDPDSVRAELYAEGVDGNSPARHEMTRVRPLAGSAKGYLYRASVSATRPAGDYTPRVVPQAAGLSVPLEAGPILWQR